MGITDLFYHFFTPKSVSLLTKKVFPSDLEFSSEMSVTLAI